MEKQKIKDAVGRYKFLLGQTDLFAHFIKSKGLMEDAADLANEAATVSVCDFLYLFVFSYVTAKCFCISWQ